MIGKKNSGLIFYHNFFSGVPTCAKSAWDRAPCSWNMVNLFSFGFHVIDQAYVRTQPRPQGLLVLQYGGGGREDPGTQLTKTIADWCISLHVHTCALIGLFIPKQRWLLFEDFVEAEKCFRQCLRPKRWTEFRSDCSENCDCTVGRQRFEDSDI